MTYKKLNLDLDTETAFQVGQHKVALSVERQRLPNGFTAFNAKARWIDAKGKTRMGAESEFHHSIDAATLEAVGADKIARDMLLLLLGEEPEHIHWSTDVRAHTSILHHIALARASGRIDLDKLL
jgi:hypothetical protein